MVQGKRRADNATMEALTTKLIVTVKVVIPPCTGSDRGSHSCNEYLEELDFTPEQMIGHPGGGCSGSPAKRWWLGKRGPRNPSGGNIEACPLKKPTKKKTGGKKKDQREEKD